MSTAITMLPLGVLVPSEANPRKTFDVQELSQLATSISAIGIQVPLLVRLIDDFVLTTLKVREQIEGGEVLYEIVAGHRRFEAAKLAALKELPCIVREMSDDEAREIMVVENLQRQDLPPLEEADAYDGLLSSLGSVANVAARVGKPIEYVTRRLKLRTLTPLSRRALAEKLIAIDHALLLCKLAAKEQDEMLKWALDVNAGIKTSCELVLEGVLKRRKERDGRWGYWEARSVLDLKHHIEQVTELLLAKAPWDLKDANLLPSAGACADCAKNTAHNTALFGDLLVEKACCTDSQCFDAKRQAFVQVQMEAVASAGGKALRLSWRNSSAAPRSTDFSKQAEAEGNLTAKGLAFYGQIFKEGQWVEAKKGSCPHARLGVTVDYSRNFDIGDRKKQIPGVKLWVCVTPKCKAHPKAWEKAKKSSTNAGFDAKAEAEKRESGEFRAKIETRIREKIWYAILPQIGLGKALRLAADQVHNAAAIRKELLERFPKIGGELLEALVLFWDALGRGLEASGYSMRDVKGIPRVREKLWSLAKSCGIDANAIAAKHFHDGGSIPPAAEPLYPKGLPWPKDKVAPKLEKKEVAVDRQSSKPGAANQQRPASKSAAKKSAAKKSPAKKVATKAAKKGGR